MVIIGEKLNSSIPSSKAIIEQKNAEEIIKIAKAQAEGGANYIDINAGTFLEKEAELLSFMAKTLGKDFTLSIDTPSFEAAKAAVEAAGGSGHIINSVTIEKQRLEHMTALASEHGCGVVTLCMQESGMPDNLENRLSIADRLVGYLTANGIKSDDIYIDPMLKPLGADPESGTDALETIRRLRKEYPDCHITCGLSNMSYGLPKRKLLNRAFAVSAVISGLDAAILDPLDRELMGLIAAAEAIAGKDEYCLEYIGKCRSGEIG